MKALILMSCMLVMHTFSNAQESKSKHKIEISANCLGNPDVQESWVRDDPKSEASIIYDTTTNIFIINWEGEKIEYDIRKYSFVKSYKTDRGSMKQYQFMLFDKRKEKLEICNMHKNVTKGGTLFEITNIMEEWNETKIGLFGFTSQYVSGNY